MGPSFEGKAADDQHALPAVPSAPASALDRFLRDLAAATQPLEEPLDKMQTTARMSAEELGADRCAYAIVRLPSRRVRCASWWSTTTKTPLRCCA